MTNNNNVKMVYHGNVFNTGHWYTFYCPHCGSQITKDESENTCKTCGKRIDWENK